MAIIRHVTFSYNASNHFDIIGDCLYIGDANVLVNSLYEKYGDSLWYGVKNINEYITQYSVADLSKVLTEHVYFITDEKLKHKNITKLLDKLKKM